MRVYVSDSQKAPLSWSSTIVQLKGLGLSISSFEKTQRCPVFILDVLLSVTVFIGLRYSAAIIIEPDLFLKGFYRRRPARQCLITDTGQTIATRQIRAWRKSREQAMCRVYPALSDSQTIFLNLAYV
jgi:hypothetical protein